MRRSLAQISKVGSVVRVVVWRPLKLGKSGAGERESSPILLGREKPSRHPRVDDWAVSSSRGGTKISCILVFFSRSVGGVDVVSGLNEVDECG